MSNREPTPSPETRHPLADDAFQFRTIKLRREDLPEADFVWGAAPGRFVFLLIVDDGDERAFADRFCRALERRKDIGDDLLRIAGGGRA